MKTVQSQREISISKDFQELTYQAAAKIYEISQKSIEEKGVFNLALCGGLIARGVYSVLAGLEFEKNFDWSRTHLFWTDEKFLSAKDSNTHYHLAAEVLLTRVDIPIENIHPIRTHFDDPKQSVKHYRDVMQKHLPKDHEGIPYFDLTLLNLGLDGGVASLHDLEMKNSDSSKFFVSRQLGDNEAPRMTITYSAINASSNVMLMVSGRKRSSIVKQALSEPYEPTLPIHRVHPSAGTLFWYLDEEAAALVRS